MRNRVKLDFLNWRPDQDELENPLHVCRDILHRPEGWVPFKAPSTGAQSTNTSIGTIASMSIKPIGTNDQYAICYIHDCTQVGAGYMFDMSVGMLNSSYSLTGIWTTVSSGTVSTQYTLNRVNAFDVCELGGNIFFVARGSGTSNTALSGSSIQLVAINGYADT